MPESKHLSARCYILPPVLLTCHLAQAQETVAIEIVGVVAENGFALHACGRDNDIGAFGKTGPVSKCHRFLHGPTAENWRKVRASALQLS